MSLDEKKEFLEEHFFYEVEMFLYSSNKLNDPSIEQDHFLKNTLLESFTSHARCLIEFFYPKDNTREDDATASDFFDNWSNVRGSLSESLKTLKTRVGKEIVHLTYKRISGYEPEKVWDIMLIRSDLLAVIKLFVNSLDQHLLGERLNSLKKNLK